MELIVVGGLLGTIAVLFRLRLRMDELDKGITLLGKIDPGNRVGGAEILGRLAQKSVMRIWAVPALKKALNDYSPVVRKAAAGRLTGYYLHKNRWPKVFALLDSPDPVIVGGVVHTIDMEIRVLPEWRARIPIFCLEEMQDRLEQSFARITSERYSSPAALRERIALRDQFTQALDAIASTKANYARRQDGELLAGETIPRPTRRGDRLRNVLVMAKR